MSTRTGLRDWHIYLAAAIVIFAFVWLMILAGITITGLIHPTNIQLPTL